MSPERASRDSGDVPRARRLDAERNRAALLAAAERLFDERGPEAPLDGIARRAGVANATLYRHFPTRVELIIAVYAGEVDELGALAERLLETGAPEQALGEWLRAFVWHVATKRDLALALPDGPDGRRPTLFAGWHATMHAALERLLERARAAGAVRPETRAEDLLALATGIALTGCSADRLDLLLELAHRGYARA